eukprot:5572963-Amphidinium_carterae.1
MEERENVRSTMVVRDAMEDRETMFELKEEREIDNEYMTGSEYNEIEDNKETEKYSEYDQTMRFCSETDKITVHMIKMNIKLPNPTAFDGRNPQFNEWAEE